jgi:hypothetical protein
LRKQLRYPPGVSIFTKRNALIGYVVLKKFQWKRRHRGARKTFKIVAFVALALVSAGILAGLLAVALRRQRADVDALDELRRLEGFASADDELGLGLPEPGFAA